MKNSTQGYHEERALQEYFAAREAAHPAASQAHLVLATLHLRRLASISGADQSSVRLGKIQEGTGIGSAAIVAASLFKSKKCPGRDCPLGRRY